MRPQDYWKRMDGFAWNAVWDAAGGDVAFRVRLTGEQGGSREWDIEYISADGRWHYYDTLYGLGANSDVAKVLRAANNLLTMSGLAWVREGN